MKHVTDKENTATILAALRLFQRTYQGKHGKEIRKDWPEHFKGVRPLSSEDIETLCQEINFGEVVCISKDEKEAIGEILDLAYGDQESYLMIGNPHIDYATEWPFAAGNKAKTFRLIADFTERMGLHGEKERWSGIADNVEASGKEYEEANPTS